MAKDNDAEDGLVGDVKALATLLQDYAKQETLGPLKGAGRYIAFGVAGAVLVGTGCFLLVMAGLRALQSQTGTALTGSWSWAPYLIISIAPLVIIALMVRAITNDPDGGEA